MKCSSSWSWCCVVLPWPHQAEQARLGRERSGMSGEEALVRAVAKAAAGGGEATAGGGEAPEDA